MDIYHECQGEMRLLNRDPKRVPYSPTISELLEIDKELTPRTRYWQPYGCIDCQTVVFELIGD